MALIEREGLKICKHGNGYGYCFLHEEYCLEGPCKEEELVEYAPVVHGRWKKRKDGTPYCSACGANERDFYDAVIEECRYCYSCGARMDGGEGHEAD